MTSDLQAVENVHDIAAVEDARRRLILALRGMTLQREREERNARAVRGWTEELQRHVAKVKVWERRRRNRRVFGLLAFVVLVVLSRTGIHAMGPWVFPLIFGALLGGAAAADVRQARTEQVKVAANLARARDPHAVSALAIACRDGDTETRKEAAKGLISILPTLRASDAYLVTPDAMSALILLLQRSGPDLCLAILRGLRQIGDARALPVVQAIVRDPWRWFTYANEAERAEVQGAADECLAYLQAQAEQVRLRNVLLRPSGSPQEPAQSLLRPAGNADDPQALLLRPTSGD